MDKHISEIDISKIDTSSKEGKWLVASLSILTTEGERQRLTPYQVLGEVNALSEKIFKNENQ